MSFVVDISSVEPRIQDFPDGVYEATITNPRLDVSKKGNPVINMDLVIYHPNLGEAVVKDSLPSAFPRKVRAFWMAFNDLTAEEIAGQQTVEIENPSDLEGGQILVQLGTQENKETGRTYKSIVAPWYYPLSRAADLLGESDA